MDLLVGRRPGQALRPRVPLQVRQFGLLPRHRPALQVQPLQVRRDGRGVRVGRQVHLQGAAVRERDTGRRVGRVVDGLPTVAEAEQPLRAGVALARPVPRRDAVVLVDGRPRPGTLGHQERVLPLLGRQRHLLLDAAHVVARAWSVVLGGLGPGVGALPDLLRVGQVRRGRGPLAVAELQVVLGLLQCLHHR